MKNQIYECCKELRLSTTFAENALSMSGDNYQDYLLKVLRAELNYRNNKRKKLHLKQAGFDNIKTFEGYDFHNIVIPNTISIDGIRTLDFMNRNENLILYGRNGAGKSHMATAIGVEACMQGKKVRFYKRKIIFCDSNGRTKIREIDYSIRTLCQNANIIPEKPAHDIRRTVASEMFNVGHVPAEMIKEYLGHADTKATWDYIINNHDEEQTKNLILNSLKGLNKLGFMNEQIA